MQYFLYVYAEAYTWTKLLFVALLLHLKSKPQAIWST